MLSQLNRLPRPLKQNVALLISLSRSGQFLAENLTLPLFETLVAGSATLERRSPQEIRQLLMGAGQILKKDAQNIADGFYPMEVLRPEYPPAHLIRWAKILLDGVKLSARRRHRKAHDLKGEAEEYLSEVPEYYRRNFHFQTGGYLTSESAELYEHQVEILFIGVADAMRRLLIPLMKKPWPGEGRGLRFLEVGAGTGRLSRFMKLAYPKAHITVTDISEPYLKKAQKNLQDFKGMDFVKASAEDLPFKDKSYDFVYSCFLFHELPLKVRKKVLDESKRVLKPKGYLGMIDSAQKGETEFDWALKQFPIDFHEPFYRNYTLNPMEKLMQESGFKLVQSDIGFLSKALLARLK